MRYTVAITGEEDTSKDTNDLDAALDWFTNACTAVMDPEDDVSSATFKVNGETWGYMVEGGPPGGGEVIDLGQARKVA
jgi:hypothetical protein